MQTARLNVLLMMLGALALVTMPPAMQAQEKPARVELITGVRHAVSPPLRAVVPTLPSPASGVIPLRRPVPARPGPSVADPVLQVTTTANTSSSTASGLNFDGISSDGYIPPDTNLAVGATQVVQTVNVDYAVYDKVTGAQLLAPMAIHNIFAALGAPCGNSDGGDPVVLYDKSAGRWLISQLEYNRSFRSNYECVAISTSSDATGSFNLYAFSFSNNLPDYPKWGSWPDAYYLSANLFHNGSTFVGAAACAFPRDLMLAGQPVSGSQVICFQIPSEASLLPADLDGTTPPAAGEPGFYANLDSTLKLYRFYVDFATPSNSTFTGPIAVSGAASFNEACGGGACVPQPSTNQKLDSLGDRLMFRLAYRNFGTYESLVVNHSVQVNSGSNQTGVRWYEIRSPNSAPTIYQQGTYSPDTTTYRWMGSIAQDQNGNIAVGYSVSDNSSVYPGIRYAGRVPTDPLGTLQAEATIIDGSGYQSSYNRWGDYSAMSIDPSDDCTFWYTTEYILSSGSFVWHTRIASFKFSGCGTTTSPSFSLSASPASQTVTQGDGTTYDITVTPSGGFTGDVALSFSSLPAGPTGSFNPNSVLGGSGSSTLSVGTSSSPADTYTLTVTGTSGSLSSSTQVTLVVNASSTSPPDPPTNLAAKAAGRSGKVSLSWTQSTSPNITQNKVYRQFESNGYTLLATLSATTSYTDSSTSKGTNYCYEVTAVNASGQESSASSPACAVAGATAK
jgi:hypothetical protein